MGLALRQRVAADHAAGAPEFGEVRDQRQGQALELVGDHAPGNTPARELLQHLADPLEGHGMARAALGVMLDEAPLALGHGLFRRRGHGPLDQTEGAARHAVTVIGHLDRRQALGLPNVVQRRHQVGGGVEEGAVEVEKNGPDHVGSARRRAWTR